MVQTSDHDFLSTTRINRFLRPLRNKCSALVAFDAQTVSLPTYTNTYSSVKSFTQPDIPPLCTLPPPESSTRLAASSCERSWRIYAVSRAFKDIVEKTETLRVRSEGENTARLPSLSTLCAFVIGEHAEPDIEGDVTRLEEEHSVDIVGTLYEGIPALYRGSTLVSHALHIILDECPLTPTLLKLLLDITLDNHLVHQSEILLCRFLSIALSPSAPTRPPPVCHPAHSNFLIELLGRWEQKCNPSCVFIKVLNDTMAVVGTYDAWVCKATTKLLLFDCRQDPLQFASVSTNLVKFISKPELHFPFRQSTVSTIARTSPTGALRRSLRVWLECVLHYLLFSVQEVDHYSFYDFLITCKEFWVHLTIPNISTAILPLPEQDAVSAIVSVTTFLLSQGLVSGHAVLSQILSEKIRPSTTLFSLLISQTLASFARLPDCAERIQTYAASLRNHGFLELEVSLWASALREIENFGESPLKHYDKVALHEYRSVLIDCVEDAEQRCYGCSDEVPDIVNTHAQRNEQIDSGCLKRGLRKRPHSENRWNDWQPNKRPRRRISSFTSLLSNALSNHVVLHREGKQSETNGLNYDSKRSSDGVDVEGLGIGIEDLSGEDFKSIHPSSDDCLDLLAYGTSPLRS
ncbi:hypothetical protein J3R30DRAFT_3715175 [Lentinula aciculospora]|uniref:Uncharacterized protein n=1 Tax=Lentinula aciculospora TaxID=153920 RepID=A0A9W8ZVW8_9AGAR|nr:hypothetical protein J3R30DRAFT_3715175 [Lentinula aciculospora]